MDEIVAERTRPLLWWDAATVLVSVVLVAVLFVGGEGAFALPHERALTIVPVLVLALLYLVLGRPALRQPQQGFEASRRRALGRWFLSGFTVLALIGCLLDPTFATLQVLGYPMIWTLSRSYREAILWSVGLSLAVGVGMAGVFWRYHHEFPLLEGIAIAVMSLLYAVAMGTWITRIFEQGERYRDLAERLRNTQQEVAELSEQAGAATERERLARELHDTLTQTLTGLVMLSEQAERRLAHGEIVEATERMGRVSDAARVAMSEARALVATSWPLGEGGLVHSIERVADRLRRDTGLRVDCELEELGLGRELEVVLLRAAQEGMANARKHARAESVGVRLGMDGADQVRLIVEDDGAGPGRGVEENAGGFGLQGLSERLRLVGGVLRFGAGEASGSKLEIVIPLAQHRAEEG